MTLPLFYGCLVLLMVPLIVYWLFLRKRAHATAATKIDTMNPVSIVVPCYNEEQHVERKVLEIFTECAISNITCFEIILISDGSTDRTNLALDRFQGLRQVRSIFLDKRMGKANAVNLGLAHASHDWVILSDVRQTIQAGSFRQLLLHFPDATVGAVSAKLDHTESSWLRRCINYLKIQENKTGSTVGVYGALYAIKKSCFVPIPTNTILDDLLISLHVLLQGKRVVFEPKAVITDIAIEPFYGRERTLRLIYGLWQLWFVHAAMILALPMRQVVFLTIQKYYKFLVPPLLVTIACLGLSGNGFDSLTGQIAGMGMLIVGAAVFIFGYPHLRFVIRLLRFSILGIRDRKKYNTVLWPKPK